MGHFIRGDGDDPAHDRRSGTFDASVGGEQGSVVAFSGGEVDRVGVAQRWLREHPGTMDVAPRGCFNVDFEGLRVSQRLYEVCILQRMVGSVRGGPKSGRDFEGEVPRREEALGSRLGGESAPAAAPRGPGSATASMTSDASTITAQPGCSAGRPVRRARHRWPPAPHPVPLPVRCHGEGTAAIAAETGRSGRYSAGGGQQGGQPVRRRPRA